jgi:hypothetical protein
MASLLELLVVFLLFIVVTASSLMNSSFSQSSTIRLQVESLKVYNLLEYAVARSSEMRSPLAVKLDKTNRSLSLRQSEEVHQEILLSSSVTMELRSGHEDTLLFHRSLVSSPARVILSNGIADCIITVSLRTRLRLRCPSSEDSQ